jgi:membrane protein
MIADLLNKVRVVFFEAVSSFRRNNDLAAASSLAFSAMLALIPTLFLLTFLLSAVIGSSGQALSRTEELLALLIPAYSSDIILEVRSVSSYMGTIGILNILVLIWSVTPLVANMRVSLGTVFRQKPNQPYLLAKLLDMAVSIVYLMALSAVAVVGVVFTLAEKKSHLYASLGYVEGLIPFFCIIAVVFLLYFAYSPKARAGDLLIGSLVTSFLWFTMTPAFNLFLTYNPGYGFAFGSFKSLFVVIIWIYYSLGVFLFGAEIAAGLGRGDTVFLKTLMEGKKDVPSEVIGKYVVRYEKGSSIFQEGDTGNIMFGILKGRVELRKGDSIIGEIPVGKCFGAISFLLSIPRVATATALEDVELVTISNENIDKLMNEYPEFVIEILREIALRLREANKVVD